MAWQQRVRMREADSIQMKKKKKTEIYGNKDGEALGVWKGFMGE